MKIKHPLRDENATDSTVTPASHTLVLLPTDNYAFKDVELQGNEWIELQEDHWTPILLANREIVMLVCLHKYCFVFFDEADQCSQPYPTVQEAMDARKRYMEHLLGDTYAQADEMNDNMRKYGTINKPADV